MAYEVVMPYHLHMPSYFLETFTEYPYLIKWLQINRRRTFWQSDIQLVNYQVPDLHQGIC